MMCLVVRIATFDVFSQILSSSSEEKISEEKRVLQGHSIEIVVR